MISKTAQGQIAVQTQTTICKQIEPYLLNRLINTAQGNYQYHEILRLMKINNPRTDKCLEQLSFTLARFFDVLSSIPNEPVAIENKQKPRKDRDSRIICDFMCCKLPISKI